MKVVVVSPKNRPIYNLRGDLIRKIISLGNEVIATGPNRENIDMVESLGVKFVEVPLQKNGLDPINDLKYMNDLRKLFKKERPDVVFGYTSKPVIYGTIAAKLAGVPHKATMIPGAGYAFTSKSAKAKVVKFVMSILYKIAFKFADVVIFQNDDDRKQFIEEKLVKTSKCKLVNGSGVNHDRFPIVDLPHKITFFMLSRVLHSKGIKEYIEACEKIKNKYPEVRCMLLGGCENTQDAIPYEYIKKYADAGIIEYFGETTNVIPYFEQCSVYVLPSYREGTPRTILEAMSMGRAIITTDAPGCRGTVIDGKTGFLVPVKNAEAVAEKMEEFIKNPDLIKTMGAESAKYCREKYDVNLVNEDMCRYLNIKEG